MTSLVSTAEQADTEGSACRVQFLIARGQRQAETLRQFEIGSIINCEPKLHGQLETWSTLGLRFRHKLYWQLMQESPKR